MVGDWIVPAALDMLDCSLSDAHNVCEQRRMSMSLSHKQPSAHMLTILLGQRKPCHLWW